ncbi:MAG: NAD-dependent epimerase/dehydratase family protein, partial [Patescibacteria group bacterium]
MKVLVTGGAGFIGSHVVDRLIRDGHSVVVIDDFNDYYPPKFKEENIAKHLDHRNFKLYRGDVSDFKFLSGVFEKETFDAIVHIAARAGVRQSIQNPELYCRVNIDGTFYLLELAKAHGVKDFVFASSSSVYGKNSKMPFEENDAAHHPISPYAATKRAAELLIHSYAHLYGLNCAVLRFFTVYGERGRPDM